MNSNYRSLYALALSSLLLGSGCATPRAVKYDRDIPKPDNIPRASVGLAPMPIKFVSNETFARIGNRNEYTPDLKEVFEDNTTNTAPLIPVIPIPSKTHYANNAEREKVSTKADLTDNGNSTLEARAGLSFSCGTMAPNTRVRTIASKRLDSSAPDLSSEMNAIGINNFKENFAPNHVYRTDHDSKTVRIHFKAGLDSNLGYRLEAGIAADIGTWRDFTALLRPSRYNNPRDQGQVLCWSKGDNWEEDWTIPSKVLAGEIIIVGGTAVVISSAGSGNGGSHGEKDRQIDITSYPSSRQPRQEIKVQPAYTAPTKPTRPIIPPTPPTPPTIPSTSPGTIEFGPGNFDGQ